MYRALIGRGWGAVLLFFLAAAAGLGYFLPRFTVNAGTNELLNEDDPDLAYYNSTRPDWSYDEYAIVCCRRADWFTPESLELLQELAKTLGELPYVKKKGGLLSILGVPLLRQKPPVFGIPVPTFITDPGVDLEKARKELIEHTQARGNLISPDARDLSILVYLEVPDDLVRLEPQWYGAVGQKQRAKIEKKDAEYREAEATLAAIEKDYDRALADLKVRRFALMEAVRRVADGWSNRMEEPIRLSGLPVITVNLVEHVTSDLKTFGVASFAFFTLAFAAMYRKIRWTALPILTCLLPVLLICGSMAALEKKITVITSNLPVLLFVLMLPYTVYFIERYLERRARFPGESGLDSTAGSARGIWTPCLYSCTTTMAGFASLLTSGINPVRTFGLMMTIGMGVGLACVFLFLPAMTRRLRALEAASAGVAAQPRGVVRGFEKAVLGAPVAILLLGLAVLGVSAWGVTKIKVETKFIDYFWRTSEVYQGLDYIDNRMGGTTPLEVILTSKEAGFFKKKEGLEAIDAAARYFEGVKEVGNVRSLKSFLDEVRKASKSLTVEQLSRIKAAEGQLREFSNADYSVSRVLVRFRETSPTLHRNNVLKGLREHLDREMKPLGVDARATGIFLLYANMLNSLIESQKDTFLLVVAAIYLMLVALFRAPALAFVILVPQVLPALACLGTMGLCGVPLDLVTVMIASIAMAVGIDAAIQYTVRFRIELEATAGDYRAAVTRSHATIGRAIWIATSIVVAGFVVLALSKFVPTVYFGTFTAVAMLMGQFAALTLLPALFLVLKLPRLKNS